VIIGNSVTSIGNYAFESSFHPLIIDAPKGIATVFFCCKKEIS
jgi:hypothetical protein